MGHTSRLSGRRRTRKGCATRRLARTKSTGAAARVAAALARFVASALSSATRLRLRGGKLVVAVVVVVVAAENVGVLQLDLDSVEHL